MSIEDEKIITSFREHQANAARLSMADEVRTLIETSIGYGVISTNSDQYPGYPTGSVVSCESNCYLFLVSFYAAALYLLLLLLIPANSCSATSVKRYLSCCY